MAPEAAADLLHAVAAYFEVERLLIAHEVVDIYLKELLEGVLALLELRGFLKCVLGRVETD